MKKIIIIAVSALVLLVVAFSIKVPGTTDKVSIKKEDLRAEKFVDEDIVIPINEITETASFYQANMNGVELETLAVKAQDGSIRTAFNTCQVCYSSGRGYYVQEGDVLVCQNCGNPFSMDEVGISKGGCNPVPIAEEHKTVNADSITISKEFLVEATAIFKDWK